LQLSGTLKVNQNSTFLNGPDHTIVGGGVFISEGSFFTNEGRIEANDNRTLTISHSGPTFLFQQRGELVSSGNGILRIDELLAWSNEGLIESRDSGLVEIHFGGLLTNQGAIRVVTGATMSFIITRSRSSSKSSNPCKPTSTTMATSMAARIRFQ